MTERLYYQDSFLYEFDARVMDVVAASPAEPRPALVFDRTAFYPTSGGQVFDTGRIRAGNSGEEVPVVEVAEREDGAILHFLAGPAPFSSGAQVHGTIDVQLRRDHMQQHSGQHVLSAAFVRLYAMPTLSFHMGDDYCSIDLEAKALSAQQLEAAERLANEVVLEDRAVDIRFVSLEEARQLGLRKLPMLEKDELRLIDIREFDLTACGGTHVRSTGQIGCILLRKTERVRQGIRVEFVCGQRAVRTARHDYTVLSESASLYSAHIWGLPEQIRKAQEEAKSARRAQEQLLEELAEQHAARLLSQTPATAGRKVVLQLFTDRGLGFIKLLAQKITRLDPAAVALLGSAMGQPALVFAQASGQPFDMGALMKNVLATLGGRGGGSKDMAQGGPQRVEGIEDALKGLASGLQSSS
jgi:alanyl-tRNA synthetase